MALFLHRAAKVAGIGLADGAGVDLGDIAGLQEEWQTAVRELVASGIMDHPRGRFDPDGGVPRRDMAYFLVRFAAAASDRISIGGGSAEVVLIDGAEPDDTFADLGDESVRHINSIEAAYELGITHGTKDPTIFDPGRLVTREQMAAFITRTLAHTRARPAGISAQLIDGSVIVSLRGEDHQPVANRPVNAFYVPAGQAGAAFGAGGACRTDIVKPLDIGTGCEISAGAAVTDAGGDAEVPGLEHVDTPAVVWAWTGSGDTFNTATSTFYRLQHQPAPETEPELGRWLRWRGRFRWRGRWWLGRFGWRRLGNRDHCHHDDSRHSAADAVRCMGDGASF